jgi:hypothetical protein
MRKSGLFQQKQGSWLEEIEYTQLILILFLVGISGNMFIGGLQVINLNQVPISSNFMIWF